MICAKCLIEKDRSQFYSRTYCKPCFNKYCCERWVKRKLSIIEKFGNKCCDCNQSYHKNVYDIHHLDPSKKTLDWRKLRQCNETTLNKELENCVLLCANCHRLRHALEYECTAPQVGFEPTT